MGERSTLKSHKTILMNRTFHKSLHSIRSFFGTFGFDPAKFFISIIALPSYFKDAFRFYSTSKKARLGFTFGVFPMLSDKYAPSGFVRGHYFIQDLFVAQEINANQPENHVDIGSRIDGFIAHLASFRKVEIIDIRPLELDVDNISFIQMDFSAPLNEEYHGYSSSVSCLHTLEHFGLGRYGDQIDPGGFLKGLDNLYALCRRRGILYLSVPIGKNKVFFNAHRTFDLNYLIHLFQPRFSVHKLSIIDDDGNFFRNVALDDPRIHNSFNCKYGCGIFQLIKSE